LLLRVEVVVASTVFVLAMLFTGKMVVIATEDDSSRKSLNILVLLVSVVGLGLGIGGYVWTKEAGRSLASNAQARQIRRKLRKFQLQCGLYIIVSGIASIVYGTVLVLKLYNTEPALLNAVHANVLAFMLFVFQISSYLLPTVLRSKKVAGPGTFSRVKLSSYRVHVAAISTDTGTSNVGQPGQATLIAHGKISKMRQAHTDVVGVSLFFLKQFQREHGIPDEWSMSEVCERVIKAQTCAETTRTPGGVGLSYAELIGPHACDNATGTPYFGRATRFFSYSWAYSWSVVLSTIESFDESSDSEAREFYFI
jgi:hypothetical protein